jgi:hypothetical protein
MNTTIGVSQASLAGTTLASTSAQTGFLGFFCSPALSGAQTVGGSTFDLLLAVSESNLNANFGPGSFNVYVWRPGTGAKVGTIWDGAASAAQEPGSASSEQVTGTFNVTATSVSAADGDVIVCEVWSSFTQGMATAYTATIFYDGTTENTTTFAVVSNYAAYLSFPETLTFKGGGTNVNVPGAGATASAGSLSPQNTINQPNVPGAASTSAAGVVALAESFTLPGAAVTVTASTAAIAEAKALTGAGITATAGSLPDTDAIALGGAAVTASAGVISAQVIVSVALPGASATASAKAIAAALAKTLPGASVTSSAGTMSVAVPVTLPGAAATATAAAISFANVLHGVAAVAAAGVLAASVRAGLTGVVATATAGAMSVRIRLPPTPFDTLIASPKSLAFFTVEFDGYIPAAGTASADELAWLAAPPLALSLESDTISNTTTFRAADVPYKSEPASSIGQQPFQPLVKTAFALDQRINLMPTANTVMAAWGQVDLDNPRDALGVGYWDNVVASHNVQGRAITIKMGAKLFESLRQMHTDPIYSSLYQVFSGVMDGLFLDLKTMTLSLRDIGYLIEKPIQSDVYAGTGGAEGNAELTGKPKPMTRGGTGANPVPNVTPVLIDPTNRIYQYSDAPGTVVNLYERGLATFTADGNVAATYAALVSATVASGHYATANAVSMFKLGTTPVGQITADVTGQFPSDGVVTTVVAIAKSLLSDDLAIAPGLIDSAAFTALDAAYPYVAGIYIGAEQTSAVDQLGLVMGSINGRLVVGNAGTFRPIVLAAAAGTPKDAFTTAEIAAIRPLPLPTELLTPVFSWQVGYQRNYTVQTTDIAPTVTDARRQFLSGEFRYATGFSADVLTQYRFLNTPPPLPTILLAAGDAQTVADSLIALWSVRRRLYDTQAVIDVLQRDIGDVVTITYPMDDMAGGKLGVVIGRSLVASGRAASLLILA